jgi:hypothetical protein
MKFININDVSVNLDKVRSIKIFRSYDYEEGYGLIKFSFNSQEYIGVNLTEEQANISIDDLMKMVIEI